MKIKFQRVPDYTFTEKGYLTVGYWFWDKPNNQGTLTVQVTRLCDWRFEAAVWGHELIEVFYCWLRHITTEVCDAFDESYERAYEAGTVSKSVEPGCDPKCPYHWGHMAGIVWEHICIYGTFASWTAYEKECNRVMKISEP